MFCITHNQYRFALLFILLLSVASPTDIGTCTNLALGDSYFLTADINVSLIGDSDCFNITGNNILLDLQNHRIDGTSFAHNGIFYIYSGDPAIHSNNVTIVNAEVRYSANSIMYIYGVENSTFANMTLANTTGGSNAITITSNSQGNKFFNMTVANSTLDGLLVDSGCVNNTFDNITSKFNTDDGISIGASYNNITNSLFYNNSGHGISIEAADYSVFVNVSALYNSVTDKAGLSIASAYGNFTNITADYNYNGISVSGTANNNNFSQITARNNSQNGIEIAMTMGGTSFDHSIIDIVQVANNTVNGFFLNLLNSMGTKQNITLKGGSVFDNLNGINILDISMLGGYGLTHFQLKNMLVYNNTNRNINITGSYNTTILNVTSQYVGGTPPVDWMGIDINNTVGSSISSANFSTNGTGFRYNYVSSANFNATNCYYNSGAKYANVSLYTNSGNYTVTAWNSAPAAAPYGTDLGYYVNITNDSAIASLNITFFYTDADVAGLTEASMKMYKYGGATWTDVSTLPQVVVTVDTAANSISATNVSSFSVFGIFAPVGYGAIRLVDPGGLACIAGATTTHATIQAAIDMGATSAGDRIYICPNLGDPPDTYNENVVVNKSVNISGVPFLGISQIPITNPVIGIATFSINSSWVNITNMSFSTTVFTGGSTVTNAVEVNSTATYLRFYNNTLTGGARGLSVASTYANISSNNINGSTNGIFLTGAKTVMLEFNNLTNNSYGIYLAANSNNINITSNNISDSSHTGFYDASGSYSNFTNNTVKNSTVYGVYLCGATDCDYFQMIRNNISNSSDYSVNVDGANYLNISSNNISFGLSSGIYLTSSYSNFSFNNVFNHTGNSGFSLSGGQYSNFTNNSVYFNGKGFYITSSTNQFISNNVSFNSQYGFEPRGDYSNFTANIVRNNTLEGFYLADMQVDGSDFTFNQVYFNLADGFDVYAATSNFTSNTVYNNSHNGFNIRGTGSMYNNFSNNSVYNNSYSGFSLASGSVLNHLSLNNASENHLYGFSISATNNTFHINRASNNTLSGFHLSYSAHNTTITNSTSNNNSLYGITVMGSSENNISSTIFNGNVYAGIMLFPSAGTASFGNRLFNNTFGNHTQNLAAGIYVNESGRNFIYNNTMIIGNTYGIYINASNTTNISSNIAYNNTFGFNFWNATNISLISNTVYNSTFSNILLYNSSNNLVMLNHAYNSSMYGFNLTGGTGNNLTSNNASNNTLSQFYFSEFSNATFKGLNWALATSLYGEDVNISGGSVVSTYSDGAYNGFNTTNGSIFFNATNVSIHIMTLNESPGTTGTGCDGSYTSCTLITYNYTNSNSIVVNISNNSQSGALLNLGMYYDPSLGTASANYNIGKYNNAVGGWTKIGVTALDEAADTVRYDGITTFSTFGVVEFVPAPASSLPRSSDDSSTKSFVLSKAFDCETGKLAVTTSGVERVELSLIQTSPNYILVGTASTTLNGAEFTITQSGTYKILAVRPGYYSEQMADVDLTLCSEQIPQITPECTMDSDCFDDQQCLDERCISIFGQCGYTSDHEWIGYECCADDDCFDDYVCENHKCSYFMSDAEKAALEALRNANGKIAIAKSEGKDVSAAELAYAEAQGLFDLGDHVNARAKAEQAISLIRGKPKASDMSSTTTQQQSPANQEPPKQDMGGLILMLGAGVVLLVVLVGAYFVMKGGKGKH